MASLILGIDPGSRATGYAILQDNSGKLRAVQCDTIRLAHLDDHSDRLQLLFEEITGIIARVKPQSAAVETPVYGQDPMAMLKLGRAQAACLLAITNSGLSVTEYYPKEIKKSITGNGNASKEQVAHMLHRMITIPQKKLTKDATDALAIAWCHWMKAKNPAPANTQRHKNNQKSGWKSFVENNPDRISS